VAADEEVAREGLAALFEDKDIEGLICLGWMGELMSRGWSNMHSDTTSRALAALVLLLGASVCTGHEFHVAEGGDDQNPGTSEQPFATLVRARDAVRKAKQDAEQPTTVIIHDGIYYMPETLAFGPEDSGTEHAPIVYQAQEGARPVISGGIRLDLKWQPVKDGIAKAKLPDGVTGDQLFVNGQRQHMARYPNFDPAASYFNGFSADCFGPERAARWGDPTGGFFHAMHRSHWGDMHFIITGKDEDGIVVYGGGWQNNRPSAPHREHRFVENLFEELDAPGEWYLNANTGELFFFHVKGVDLGTARIELVARRHLIEFRGTEDNPAHHIEFHGLTFTHTARTFMDNREPLLRSDWTIYRGGAVVFTGAEDCTIADCDFLSVGGNTVFVNRYNRRITIRGCNITDSGANGVCFVGDPGAVRSPRFQYSERHTFEEIDKEPGPKTNDYPADCLVEDCLIRRTGRFEKQTAPIQISMSARITVRHCSIYDVPRAGINVSEGTWGGHVIEYCDVFDTVKETGDHGSFNSWGRDRFWGLKDFDLNTVTLGEHKNLPLLDVVETIVIRNNRWRCDHGWDIDLDDGSSNYHIYNNLCLHGGLKNREGFYRTVENNVIVNNSFHPHVWYQNSQDVFRRNLVFTPYRPIRVPTPWGEEIDHNLLHQPDCSGPAMKLQEQSGRDLHSIVGDAMFVDPENGDYRVGKTSPALELGFENFAMDNFGVTSERLKTLASTPDLPHARLQLQESERDGRIHTFLGAKVKNIVGMGEVSASGLPGEVGVLVVEVPDESRAAGSGLRAEDVILGIGGDDVDAWTRLAHEYRGVAPGEKVKLKVFRDQRDHFLDIEGSARVVLNAGDAQFVGEGARPVYDPRKDYLGSWRNAGVGLQWKTQTGQSGTYRVNIVIACADGSAGTAYEVQLNDKKLTGKVLTTGHWERFVEISLGQVELEAGDLTVTLDPLHKPGQAVMNLREIALERVGD